MCGWVKLSRDVIETELWKEVVPFRLFLLLVTQATREDGRMVNGMRLKKGQYIRAYSKLAEDLGYREGRGEKLYSKSTIKRAVDKLVKKRLIFVEESSVGTLFTLLNLEQIQRSGFVDFFCSLFRETKGEPTENKEETNKEQNQEREQKVEKEEDAPSTIPHADSKNEERTRKIEAMTKKFIGLRKKGTSLSATDLLSLQKLADQEVPLEQLMAWMEEIHSIYTGASPQQTIHSMKYYEAAIFSRLAKLKAKSKSNSLRGETLDERMARLEHQGRL
ncbi:hypothetical protein [Bacillus sp. B15-48]|uniref:hypothetical protein n=1 Tax=Bacillus sp. B15-48 TaxID=1548601 RepID=UPI00193FBFB0|nr:hypothetical protein [Bacillus sp. B15-48]MBM4764571.1 hypothetical protein [Bacillus sp. B15-48]